MQTFDVSYIDFVQLLVHDLIYAITLYILLVQQLSHAGRSLSLDSSFLEYYLFFYENGQSILNFTVILHYSSSRSTAQSR